MSENIFEKFNSMVDIEGLKKDVATAEASDGEYVEVPYGDYEVKVTKIELGATGEKSKTPGAPIAKVWFSVLAGDFKGQLIFMNQMLTSGFGIHKMNEFLNSLETGIPVQFENFQQYADLFAQIFAEVDGKAEFQLSYTQNNKGYAVYNIVQRFTESN
jgi:hypothetical protein